MNKPEGPMTSAPGNTARLSLLGHDLRAAVSDIIGGLRLINQSALDDNTSLQLERVRASGEVLARLLEEAFAEMGAEGDIGAALPANVQMLRFLHDIEVRWSGRAKEKGLDFHIVVGSDVPKVLTLDRIALERAIANILSNAIKYTDAGEIRLSVVISNYGDLRISVRDQGPGFSKAALARLYEYQGRPENTEKPGQGLGLHISKDMTIRMGGTIVVDNLSKGGAEVIISLPPGSWEARAAEPERPLPDLSRVKVLVAEDNVTNQTIIGQMLTRMGAEFELAEDGVEAMHWLERERFDLALIDIEMPRLSGVDVIRGLRRKGAVHADMPIIAITAYVLRANRDAIYAAGADAILAKPLAGIDAFGQALADVLQRGQAVIPAEGVSETDGEDLNRERFDNLLSIAGPEAATELLHRLAKDLSRAERSLIAGLSETNHAAIRAETHVLISLAGAVGAERLQSLAEALNAAAHHDDDALIRDLGQQALNDLDRLIHFVDQEQTRRGDRA